MFLATISHVAAGAGHSSPFLWLAEDCFQNLFPRKASSRGELDLTLGLVVARIE